MFPPSKISPAGHTKNPMKSLHPSTCSHQSTDIHLEEIEFFKKFGAFVPDTSD